MCDVLEIDGEDFLYLEDEDVLVAEDGTEIYLDVEEEDEEVE